MSDWQPIETAPEDEQILVWSPAESRWDNGMAAPVWTVVKSVMEDGEADFFIEHDGDGGYMSWQSAHPTHWMPLPDPPEQTGAMKTP